jgi:hypothetical protein
LEQIQDSFLNKTKRRLIMVYALGIAGLILLTAIAVKVKARANKKLRQRIIAQGERNADFLASLIPREPLRAVSKT